MLPSSHSSGFVLVELVWWRRRLTTPSTPLKLFVRRVSCFCEAGGAPCVDQSIHNLDSNRWVSLVDHVESIRPTRPERGLPSSCGAAECQPSKQLSLMTGGAKSHGNSNKLHMHLHNPSSWHLANLRLCTGLTTLVTSFALADARCRRMAHAHWRSGITGIQSRRVRWSAASPTNWSDAYSGWPDGINPSPFSFLPHLFASHLPFCPSFFASSLSPLSLHPLCPLLAPSLLPLSVLLLFVPPFASLSLLPHSSSLLLHSSPSLLPPPTPFPLSPFAPLSPSPFQLFFATSSSSSPQHEHLIPMFFQ